MSWLERGGKRGSSFSATVDGCEGVLGVQGVTGALRRWSVSLLHMLHGNDLVTLHTDYESGASIRRVAMASTPWRIALSPDNSKIATACGTGGVFVFDTDAFTELKHISGEAMAVAFSHSGDLLVGGSSRPVIMDAATYEILRSPLVDESTMYMLSFSPSDALLISGHSRKCAVVWDVSSMVAVVKLTGHTDSCRAAIFASEEVAVTGSDDTTVRVWSIPDGACLRTLPGHTAYVLGLAMSPNQEYVVSTAMDRTVKLWRTSDWCVFTPVVYC